MSLTVAIITNNEELNIRDCLKTVSWADEIVLVDSGSYDHTVEIARTLGAKTWILPFRDFASQKNAALDHAAGDWVFFLDADERVPHSLASEIQQRVRSKEPRHAFAVKRETYFFKRRLRFSGTQQDFPIRLFPRGSAYFDQPVHEKVVTPLPLRRLKNPLTHFSTPDFAHYRIKLERYLPLELEILRIRGGSIHWPDFSLRPLAKFAYLYFANLGILDGRVGLQFAALAAYYDFLKYRRYRNLQKQSPRPRAFVPL